MMRLMRLLSVLVAVMSEVSIPSAQCGQLQKLTAFDGLAGDFFGWSVATTGDNIAVGARNHPVTIKTDPHYLAGAVYTYKLQGTTWTLDAKLTAPAGDDNPFDAFGHSVSYDRSLLAVGAPLDDGAIANSNVGAVYVFRRDSSGWVLEAKLLLPASSTAFSLGNSVSLWDDTLIAGADTTISGTAFVYRRIGSTWSLEAELTPSNPNAIRFGTSVALFQNIAFVGAPATPMGSALFAGSAYVFKRTGSIWQETQELLNPAPNDFDQFGDAVAHYGRIALVGTPFDFAAPFFNIGTVYAYEQDAAGQYVLTQNLNPAPPSDQQHFGNAVAVLGGKSVIGAESANLSEGRAYQFNVQAGAWVQVAGHDNPNPGNNAAFGNAVGIANYAVIGAHNDNQIGVDAGAAYVFGLCP